MKAFALLVTVLLGFSISLATLAKGTEDLVAYDLGVARSERFLDSLKVFKANLYGATEISIAALKSSQDIKISHVMVIYATGEVDRVYELEGVLKGGERKVFVMQVEPGASRNITTIDIYSKSLRVMKSRGHYRLTVLAKK